MVAVHPHHRSAPRLFHHGTRSDDHQCTLASASLLQPASERSLEVFNAGSSFRKRFGRRNSDPFCSATRHNGDEPLELGLFLYAAKLWLESSDCNFSLHFRVPPNLPKV